VVPELRYTAETGAQFPDELHDGRRAVTEQRLARPLSRRRFLAGAALGAGAVGAAALGAAEWLEDPDRPPDLYEYYVDSYWFDSSGLRDEPLRPPLRGAAKADVAIVGGGFTGLSAAIAIARRQPGRRVVVLEGARCGYGASGRNGGFADVMYTGFPAFAAEQSPEVARAVYDVIATGMAAIERLVLQDGVACDLERNGALRMAATDGQIEQLERERAGFAALGVGARLVEGEELRALVRTERFRAGLAIPTTAIVNPAKLARGMARVAASLGVTIHEATRAVHIEPGRPVRIVTEHGEVAASQAVLATNGYTPQLGILRNRLLPICNYVVATEPLSPAQWEAIGWSGRQGLSDARLQFMYLRPTADGRIVAGGEGAPYFTGSLPSSGNYPPVVERLKTSLVATFPALAGIRFTNAWGGTMAFTRDFTPRIGALGDDGNLFFGLGYCGEGVVMSQVAGRILAAFLDGDAGAFQALPFVGSEPPWVGFEPFRALGVKAAEAALRALSE
jgi:glycine/D-amino acid oxidase-like deaminating enzyme